MKKSRALVAVGVLVGSCTRAAIAEEFRIAVACPGWSPEQVSQVEARIRAAILLDESPPHTVEITCREAAVEVVVRASQGNAQRPVERTTPSLEDDIVREVDVALRELRATPAPPEPSPPPPEAAPTPPPPPQPARIVAPVQPLEGAPPPSWLEVRASGVGERWSEHLALGFEVAPSLGDDRVRYGVAFGASWALGEAKGFEVSNAHAAGELAWSPRFAAGFRGTTAIGVSLLTVTPDGTLSATTATAFSAAFLQVGLSRPFTFGQFALAPGLGLRAHLAERRVRVDDVDRLVVPLFVPQLQLSLLWGKR